MRKSRNKVTSEFAGTLTEGQFTPSSGIFLNRHLSRKALFSSSTVLKQHSHFGFPVLFLLGGKKYEVSRCGHRYVSVPVCQRFPRGCASAVCRAVAEFSYFFVPGVGSGSGFRSHVFGRSQKIGQWLQPSRLESWVWEYEFHFQRLHFSSHH